MTKRILLLVLVLAMVAAACSSTDSGATAPLSRLHWDSIPSGRSQGHGIEGPAPLLDRSREGQAPRRLGPWRAA